MTASKTLKTVLAGLAMMAPQVLSGLAQAATPEVTYSWTTTSEGFGAIVGEPTTATFQAPLSDVIAGVINQSDITNIQLAYPGLTFDTFEASSGGMDFQAFVNPTTGAFVFHDQQQGLSVFGTQAANPNTFLSITIDNSYSPFGMPLTTVADQFNALDNATPVAGFPTAGFWTASFPAASPSVPEPSTWALVLVGVGAAGAALRGHRSSRPAQT